MAADTEDTLYVLDGHGDPQTLLTGVDQAGSQAYQHILRTAGAVTSPSNPQPVADGALATAAGTTNALLGTLVTVAEAGSTAANQTSEIGLLTAIANKIVGTLTSVIAAGSAVIGSVGLSIGGVSGTIKAGGTAPALADTALVVTQSPANAIAPLSTAVAASSLVLKVGAGNLYSVTCATTSVGGWLMLFDAATLPGNGTVTPAYAWPIGAANGFASFGFGVPARFLNGVVAAFSTTGPFNLTASPTAFIAGQVL